MLRLLKPSDVAHQLGVSRTWVYDAAKRGRIPSVRIGGEDGPLRFVPEDLEEWIEQARASPTPKITTRPRPKANSFRAGRSRSPGQQSLL
jgi:excisionase family DNA binding protein